MAGTVKPCPVHRTGLRVLVHDRGLEGLAPRCGKAHRLGTCGLQAGHGGRCE